MYVFVFKKRFDPVERLRKIGVYYDFGKAIQLIHALLHDFLDIIHDRVDLYVSGVMVSETWKEPAPLSMKTSLQQDHLCIKLSPELRMTQSS